MMDMPSCTFAGLLMTTVASVGSVMSRGVVLPTGLPLGLTS